MPQFDVSEGIAKGHPDKVADQISDAIVDACLLQDPTSRVAVETMVSHDLVAIGGELSTSATLDFHQIVQEVFESVGYTNGPFGNMFERPRVVLSLSEQSKDISQSVGERKAISSVCAGDQGSMIGFACDETVSFMPKSYEIARTIVQRIEVLRASDPSSILGPDGKTQAAIDRADPCNGSLIISWQHVAKATVEDVRALLTPIAYEVASLYGFQPNLLLINPSGRFVSGGPIADTGLTGRKQVSDSYGASVRLGGGAYSGKDATKVDRSGAYMGRYVAKHIVAAGLASRCEIQLVYSIGKPLPLCIGINCFGTERVGLRALEQAIRSIFDFSVGGIIKELQLCVPIYRLTAHGGHFGRQEFSWEALPHVEALRQSALSS